MNTSERAAPINGVPGRMFSRVSNPKGTLWVNQRWISEQRKIPTGPWAGHLIQCEIEFDDSCGNGHHSFGITGNIGTETRISRTDPECFGCIHEEIALAFPELEPLIKWHLSSTDGPMHYLANTCYHASDRDHNGKAAGEADQFTKAVRFNGFPIKSQIGGRFWKWLQGLENFDLEVMAVEHVNRPGDTYKFKPRYTFLPFGDGVWHQCPFDTEGEALDFLNALQNHSPEFIEIPTGWSEGKQRDFDAARICAVWPEATEEQLSLPWAELEQLLTARLPGLLANMRADMEAAGFDWDLSAYQAEPA